MASLDVSVLGIDGIRRAVGIMADAFDAASMTTINESIMRPVPGPGTSEPIMRAAFTLEQQADDAFNNEGNTALLGGWEGYSREPKYLARKTAQGGGRKIDAWYSTLFIVEVAFDDQPDAFSNINTLEELQAHEKKPA